MMLSFSFAGKDSYEDFGIVVSKRPSIPAPKRRVSSYIIPGRNSSLRYDEKTYEDITVTVECSLKDGMLPDKIDEIKDWLFQAGEDDLVFSFQPDRKYIAQVVNSIDFSQAFRQLSEFVIVFSCQPFKYAADKEKVIITEQPSVIENPGTLPCEPVITIYGTGDVSLSIAGRTVKLYNLTDYIVVDTPLLECYRGSELRNRDMVGNFPEIMAGGNTASWLGNITRIEVEPNFRWL